MTTTVLKLYIKRNYGTIEDIQKNCITSFKYIERYNNPYFKAANPRGIIYVLWFPSKKEAYIGQTKQFIFKRLNRYVQPGYINKTKSTLITPYMNTSDLLNECIVYIIKDPYLNHSTLNIFEEVIINGIKSVLNIELTPTFPRIRRNQNYTYLPRKTTRVGTPWSAEAKATNTGTGSKSWGIKAKLSTRILISNAAKNRAPTKLSNIVLVYKKNYTIDATGCIDVTICSSRRNAILLYKPLITNNILTSLNIQRGISKDNKYRFIELTNILLPYKFVSKSVYIPIYILFSSNIIILNYIMDIINKTTPITSSKQLLYYILYSILYIFIILYILNT